MASFEKQFSILPYLLPYLHEVQGTVNQSEIFARASIRCPFNSQTKVIFSAEVQLKQNRIRIRLSLILSISSSILFNKDSSLALLISSSSTKRVPIPVLSRVSKSKAILQCSFEKGLVNKGLMAIFWLQKDNKISQQLSWRFFWLQKSQNKKVIG